MQLQSPMSRSTLGGEGSNSNHRYDSEFSRIEDLITANTFSAEEISRLTEILNSRLDNECEKQKPGSNAGRGNELVSLLHDIERRETAEKQQETDRTRLDMFPEESDVPVGVSASPIDIARAYMAGRTSEGGDALRSLRLEHESTQPSNESARKAFLPPPLPKPSICWPGVMVHDRHGYKTPQSLRGRHRLYDFPRTPYSRSVLSKSMTNVQPDIGCANTSTSFQQDQTSIYGQVKSRGDTVDYNGSAGPIRRIRNKFVSGVRSRGSILHSSPINAPPEIVKPKIFGGFTSISHKNTELGETSGVSKYWSGDNVSDSSDRDISNPNLSSSQAIRKILEHLDRTKPTPKEKEAELKLATACRRSPFDASDAIREENIRSLHVGDHASEKNNTGPNLPVAFKKSISKSSFLVDKSMDEAKDAAGGNAKASAAVFTGSCMPAGANAVPSFAFKGTSNPIVKNAPENAFVATNHGSTEISSFFSRPQLNNGQDVQTNDSRIGSEIKRSQGSSKPSLPSLSVNKPAVSSCFTFPVSASASLGLFSEPPTPSIMPLSFLSQPVVVPTPAPAVPSYSFGTNKSTPRLVFSFPSTSDAPSHNHSSDLKFSFGTEKKTRLSFSSFGKDAPICY